MTDGLWRYSRNPNLFFEILFHWGVYFIVKPVDSSLVIISPLFNTLMIMYLPGGIRTREAERNSRFELYPSYLSYRATTSPCIPMGTYVYELLRRLGLPDYYRDSTNVHVPDYTIMLESGA